MLAREGRAPWPAAVAACARVIVGLLHTTDVAVVLDWGLAHAQWTVAEVAAALGTPEDATHRLLCKLQSDGWVETEPSAIMAIVGARAMPAEGDDDIDADVDALRALVAADTTTRMRMAPPSVPVSALRRARKRRTKAAQEEARDDDACCAALLRELTSAAGAAAAGVPLAMYAPTSAPALAAARRPGAAGSSTPGRRADFWRLVPPKTWLDRTRVRLALMSEVANASPAIAANVYSSSCSCGAALTTTSVLRKTPCCSVCGTRVAVGPAAVRDVAVWGEHLRAMWGALGADGCSSLTTALADAVAWYEHNPVAHADAYVTTGVRLSWEERRCAHETRALPGDGFKL